MIEGVACIVRYAYLLEREVTLKDDVLDVPKTPISRQFEAVQ